MPDDPKPPVPDPGDLQLDRPESSRSLAEAAACASCKQPLGEEYYLTGSAPICEACRIGLAKDLPDKSGMVRILKAAMLGLLAALTVGGLLPLFMNITSSVVGFMAVGLGLLVGIAVQKGSGGRGGRRYQVLAVILVYFGVATAYAGPVMAELGKSKPPAPSDAERTAEQSPVPKPGEAKAPSAPVPVKTEAAGCLGALGRLALLYAGMPVFLGKEDPFTLLFLAFWLWEAWKLNADITSKVTGPFRLGADPGREKSTNG
jgi:hypothetical protein